MYFLDLIMSLLRKWFGRKKETASNRRTVTKIKTVSKKYTVVQKPSDAASYYRSGIQKFNLTEYQAAIGDFSQAISLRNNFHQAFYNRGLSRLKIDDNNGAVLDFSTAIEIHPVYAKAYLNRGIAKNRLGDPEGAQQDFLKSVEIDPQLYPFFTVKKVKANNNDQAQKKDAPSEKPERTEKSKEYLKEVSSDDAENKRVLKAENEEEGFMKPLVIESEKDEYSSLRPVSEKDEALTASQVELPNENTAADEDNFKASLPDEKSEIEDLKKHGSASDEIKDDSEGNALSHKIEPVNEKELQSITNKFRQAETATDKNKTKVSSIENTSRQAEKNPVKPGTKEYEKNVKEILKLFQPGEDPDEDNDLPELMAVPEAPPEKKLRSAAEAPNDTPQDERLSRNPEAIDLDLSGHDVTVELPDQNEIKRILAESLPESRITYARGFYYRAKSKYEAGDKAGAIQDYSNAIEFYHKFSHAYLQRGIVRSELNKIAEAISDYSKAIEHNHKNPLAYYNRAMANQKYGKDREALVDFTKAILFDPRNPQLYLLRGILRFEMGQTRPAFSDWSRADILGSVQAREMLKKYVSKAGSVSK